MAGLIIQEIYAAGSTPGGQQQGVPTYQFDYVVLHNTTGTAIDLTGYALQTLNGQGTGTWRVLDLSGGSVPAFGYFLVQIGTTASSLGGDPLPVTPDATAPNTMVLGPNSAKVAITSPAAAAAARTSASSSISMRARFCAAASSV